MGATSVTGVSGAGSAAKPGVGNKGSESMSLAVHKLIGPRVVSCGTTTLSGTTGSVYYPTLVGTASQYAVFLSSNMATSPNWGLFTTSSFNITAGSGAIVNWEIVKQGIWGSPTTDLANS